MPLITELKYNANDFNNIDLDDLIVVFEGDITIVHSNDYSEYNIQRIINLLHRLCDRFYNMTYEIFSDNGNLKPLYANNNYQNIVSAVMQFAGFPKLIIGEIEESAKYNRWTLYIDNDWYDVLNSKELYQLIKTNLLSNYFDSVTINDKEYRLEDIISLKDNKMDDIPLANPLYHGTCEKYLIGILQKGLRKIQDNSAWAVNNDGYVFLTADYQIAQNYADIYARKTNSHSVVIEIDSNYLNKNNIVLDYDFTNSFTGLGSKSPYGSGEVTYSKHYKGNIASNDKRYGTKFNKIGYKGVVMPKAIKNITIGKYSITPQEYLDKYNKENNVMESKQNIREWHYPDNFDSLPDTIILYHGTDYDGMENILIDGVIDARRGRSTGETRGMNWFFTSYKDNFSHGFVYSIDINKEEINKTSNGFNYMNDNEIASYEPISIDNRNFTIHEAFGYGIEDLKNVMWRRCLQQTNNDIYEAIYLWIDKFSKLSGAQEYDISINNVIIQQILKQFIGEDELRNQGIIESVGCLNEVESDDISLSSFKVQDDLHPKIWVNNKLNSRVRLRLLDIADDFIDTLAVNWVKPKDVVFTGSLANYNWSKYSDIDLHVILDYSKVYKKKEFVEDYFNAKKEMWLNEHPKLKIYGFPVEVYVEDSEGDNTSSGVYSLYKNKWIKEPDDFQNAKLNEKYIKEYAAKLMTQVDKLETKQKKEKDEHKIETIQKQLKNVYDKVKKLRTEGLKKGGEMSSGNIIFKILRRAGYIDKIWRLINTSYDRINSLNEKFYRNSMTGKNTWFDGEPDVPAECGGSWDEIKPLVGWDCIGTITERGEEYYIFVDLNAPKDMYNFDNFIRNYVSINKDKNGLDGYNYFYKKIYTLNDDKIVIFDKYKNTYYDMLFNGINDEYRKWKMNDYLSKCFIKGNTVIAHHDSTRKITDGVIKAGCSPNIYSKQTDWGAYFWLSENSGTDQSNGGQYKYFCPIPLDEIYFIDASKTSTGSTKKEDILKEYPYIAGDWKKGDTVACQTYKATPIKWIYTIEDGEVKWYDARWNRIEATFRI